MAKKSMDQRDNAVMRFGYAVRGGLVVGAAALTLLAAQRYGWQDSAQKVGEIGHDIAGGVAKIKDINIGGDAPATTMVTP